MSTREAQRAALGEETGERAPDWLAWSGMLAGPILAAIVFFVTPAETRDEAGKIIAGLSQAARLTAGVAVLMAVWWLTQAVPIEATALVPLVLFPLLGVVSFDKAAAPYANEQVFLFLGGFMLGLALERWGLHKRVAYWIVLLMGSGPVTLIGGLMFATAFISLWISNTATAIVMLPIAASMVNLVPEPAADDHAGRRARRNFIACAVLGVGYAASIGGCGTIVGTPPNGVFVGYMDGTYRQPVLFANWLWIGLPLVAVLTPALWVLLTRVLYPVGSVRLVGARGMMRERLQELGPMSRGEKWVLAAFAFAVSLWIFRVPICRTLGLCTTDAAGKSIPWLSDAGISMTAALLLFFIPVDLKQRRFVLDWPTCRNLPWGILLLFGGGLSLASAITASGLDTAIGSLVRGFGSLPTWLLVTAVVALVIFMSEFASNVALVATILPVLDAAEKQLGLPRTTLMLPATLAASLAFMLPIATPPNAMMYATGKVSLRQMLHAGWWLDVMSLVLVSVLSRWLGHWVMGE